MARPEHCGFEAPMRAGGRYPKGTTFKQNPDGTSEAIVPDGYVRKYNEYGEFYYVKEDEDGSSQKNE